MPLPPVSSFLVPNLPAAAVYRAGLTSRVHSKTVEMSFAHSVRVLGTHEVRIGFNVGMEWGRPSRWLTFRSRPDILSQETVSVQFLRSIRGQDGINALAVEFGGRWIGAGRSLKNGYIEAGTGITVSDGITVDLDTKINIMSYLGFGWYLTSAPLSPRLGLRYVHLSNAHTNEPNYGLNLFQATFGVRF